MRQIHIVKPDGFAVAHDGLLIGAAVFPFKQPRAQNLKRAVGGLAFLFAFYRLAEAAAEAVGVGVEFFQRINGAGLSQADAAGQGQCGGAADEFSV